MQHFTVIWRGNGDDYDYTHLCFSFDFDPTTIPNAQWVAMAWEKECKDNGWSEEEAGEYDPERDGFEVIGIMKGKAEWV